MSDQPPNPGTASHRSDDHHVQAAMAGLPRALLSGVIAEQPTPLLFVTISGAHLYGFASHDSDFDLRGVHVLPVREVCGLYEPRDTLSISEVRDGVELDLVTHDVAKFFGMVLKRNGYVLEQLYSPLVLHTTPEHDELKSIAQGCITRHHAHHYLGFCRGQWEIFEKELRVKPLLYTYRVLLTGIHLMRSGEVEANLLRLNESFRIGYIDELVARKAHGAENELLGDADIAFHRSEYERLTCELERARDESTLPEMPAGKEALNDLLLRIRLL